jgi:uncharacterized membrane protein YozB (DUF420 family)
VWPGNAGILPALPFAREACWVACEVGCAGNFKTKKQLSRFALASAKKQAGCLRSQESDSQSARVLHFGAQLSVGASSLLDSNHREKSMNGFLGTGATFRADLNLVVQIMMGLALLSGMFLARRKQFRAHKYCQSSVMLLNLVMIFLIMAPSFHKQVEPQLPGGLKEPYYLVSYVHAVLGTVAEVLGVYIVLVAATKVVPRKLRFKRYKPWMRTELVLWWLVVLIGVCTYYDAYYCTFHGDKHGQDMAGIITVTSPQ